MNQSIPNKLKLYNYNYKTGNLKMISEKNRYKNFFQKNNFSNNRL